MEQTKKKGMSFGKVLMLLGVMLLMGAGGLYGYNQWIDYQAGQKSDAAVNVLVEEIQNNNVEIVETGPSEEMMKVAELDGAYYMGVQSDWSEEKLKTSPCRYSGSLEEGELVIAGHNYKRHFTGLASLPIGEQVVFTDLEGNQIFYEVREVYTISATNIEGMVNSGYDLSLFTCNYSGKARVTVRCDRVDAAE